MRLIIASRKSDLARIQAHSVGAAIQKKVAGTEIEFLFRESLGDKNLVDPLWKMPEKGVFTEDFYQDLVSGKVDMVVHSWKDLPTEVRRDTEIIATLPRADMRDLLLVRKDVWPRAIQSKALKIYSSSPRRAYNLHPLLNAILPAPFSRLEFESVRGNVPTRVEKLFASETVHGLIVAKAALDRLLEAQGPEFEAMQRRLRERLAASLMMVLPLSHNPTAAAQGALAIEIKKGNHALRELLLKINCAATYGAVVREREILAGYGGGCHQKVGVSVISRAHGESIFVRALTDQGEVVDRAEYVSKKTGLVAKTTIDKVFPANLSENSWFDREPLAASIGAGPLWIAKEEALPQDAAIETERLVWTSGIDSWKKLARRKVWVTGCSEAMGESEDPRLDAILGFKPQWTKLTHADGHKTAGFKIVATYKLKPKADHPDLSGKTHFYWMSASSFKRARELFANEIAGGSHSCGPGNTFELINDLTNGKVTIFASYKSWLKQVLK